MLALLRVVPVPAKAAFDKLRALRYCDPAGTGRGTGFSGPNKELANLVSWRAPCADAPPDCFMPRGVVNVTKITEFRLLLLPENLVAQIRNPAGCLAIERQRGL